MKLIIERQQRKCLSMLIASGERTFVKYRMRLVDHLGNVLYDADLRRLMHMGAMQGTPDKLEIEFKVGGGPMVDNHRTFFVKATL